MYFLFLQTNQEKPSILLAQSAAFSGKKVQWAAFSEKKVPFVRVVCPSDHHKPAVSFMEGLVDAFVRVQSSGLAGTRPFPSEKPSSLPAGRPAALGAARP